MKKVRGMMYPQRSKRQSGKTTCRGCGKELTPAEACYYVDGCNFAITANAPPHCRECYAKKYGIKIIMSESCE